MTGIRERLAADVHAGSGEATGGVPATLLRRLSRRRRIVVAGLAGLAVVGEGWLVLHDIFRVGGHGLDGATTNLVQNNLFLVAALLCLSRAVWVEEERGAWAALAVGTFAWFPAETLYHLVISRLDPVPFPSITDVFWLSSYPCLYAGLVLLARRRLRWSGSGLWLDGLTAALAAAALGAAVVLQVVLPTVGGSLSVVATNLAYPLADMVLIGFIVGMAALWGWRPGRSWALLGTGLLILIVADGTYLFQVAAGSYYSGAPVDALWAAAMLLVGAAAWQHPGRRRPGIAGGRPALLAPAVFVAVAIGILAYDHFTRLNLVAVSLAVLTLIGAAVRTVLAFRDLRTLAESRRQAVTDDLTGLANRRGFAAAMATAFAGQTGEPPQRAVLLVDLDSFKEINDTLGHPVGDLLLSQLGSRLAQAVGPHEVMARLGGDEFGILLAAGADADAGLEVAARIRAVIDRPFNLDGMSVRIGASVGIAVSPDHGADPAVLLQRADIAMYQAKAARSGCQVYAADRDQHTRDRLALLDELRLAIDARALEVFYQPQAELRTGRIRGVEALVRWRHPERGLLPPDTFLPLIEQAGYMPALTALVLDQALSQCRAWRDAGFDLTVAVNLCATNLIDTGLATQVADLLARHGLDPANLVLEITENHLMSDPDRAGEVISELRRLGVCLAIDDFGTGYSSLTYLRHLDVDEIKLDKSFISSVLDNPADAAIVRSCVDLARALRLSVVAEGVETTDVWNLLDGMGVELAQGYLLSRPIPADELTGWLADRRILTDSMNDTPATPLERLSA